MTRTTGVGSGRAAQRPAKRGAKHEKCSLRTLATCGAHRGAGDGSAWAQDKPYEGVTVNIVTFTGPQIAEPLQRRAPDFEKLTGAKVQVITVPFSDLYNKLLTDFATGTNSYDAAVFAPQWMGDFIEPGYLEALTERVKGDAGAEVGRHRARSSATSAPATRARSTPSRSMATSRWPTTAPTSSRRRAWSRPRPGTTIWRSPQHFNGKDLNGDGKADYGSCIAKKRNAQAYWFITSIAGNFIQTQGTGQGAFFDTETMTPLIDNEGFSKALQIYIDIDQVRPARRDQPRRRRHARPVHHRPLRSDPGLGRHRHAGDRSQDLEGRRTRSVR